MIEQRHLIPLTTAITTSTPGRGALAESLYNEAHKLFLHLPTQGKGIHSRQVTYAHEETKEGLKFDLDTQHVVATVTDEDSGLFVQLAGTIDSSKLTPKIVEGPFLTYGKKFLAEMKNPALSNTATKLWR